MLGLLGLASVIWGIKPLVVGYVVLSSLLLLAVAVGGIMTYYRRDNVDFREIYREKDRIQKEQINTLLTKLKELGI